MITRAQLWLLRRSRGREITRGVLRRALAAARPGLAASTGRDATLHGCAEFGRAHRLVVELVVIWTQARSGDQSKLQHSRCREPAERRLGCLLRCAPICMLRCGASGDGDSTGCNCEILLENLHLRPRALHPLPKGRALAQGVGLGMSSKSMAAVGLTGWAASLRQPEPEPISPRGPPIWEQPAVEDAEPGTRFEILHRLASVRASLLESEKGKQAADEQLEQERRQKKVLKSELERTRQALQAARSAAEARRALEQGAEEHSISLVKSHTAISQQNLELSADSARLHMELARRDEREIKLRAASAKRRSELMLQRRAQQQARA